MIEDFLDVGSGIPCLECDAESLKRLCETDDYIKKKKTIKSVSRCHVIIFRYLITLAVRCVLTTRRRCKILVKAIKMNLVTSSWHSTILKESIQTELLTLKKTVRF